MKESFTIIQNVNDPNRIVPIDGNVKDIVYFIDYDIYLKQIESDYCNPNYFLFTSLDKTEIWREFTKDINRCDLKINGTLMKDPNEMFNLFKKLYSEEIAYKTIMFSTPSSLALPYEILQKAFTINKTGNDKLFVVEPNHKIRYFKIDIKMSERSINFIFRKNLRLVDENGKSKYYVFIKTEFDILNDEPVFINFSFKKAKIR